MLRDSLSSVLQHLHRMVGPCGPDEVSDGELVGRFARQRDDAAFELLVWRHGPMVLGLCQRLLRQEQDAEDVFQATFLTLARKAGSIGKRDALASWLYKVAYRIACRVRGRAAVVNYTNGLDELAAAERQAEVIWRELRSVLDQEIASLPEAYRRPIILCYLQGKTNDEAARVLGCPTGTVSARLARARDRLRRRLTRRGCTLPSGVLATVLADNALAVAVLPELARSTVQSALAYVSGHTSIVSAKAIALTEGVLRIMWYRKTIVLAGMLLALAVVGTGVGLIAAQQAASSDGSPVVPQVAPGDPPARNPVAAPNGKADAQERTVEARLRSMLDTLDAPLDVKDYLNPMTFKEFIGQTYEKLAERRKEVPILVDAVAFMAEDPDRFPDPEALFNSQIKPLIPQEMKNIKLTAAMMLRLALGQIPERQATYLVRRDHILITTAKAAHPERLSVPPVRFDKKSLAEALDELAESTGATIVLDARAVDKAKTPITTAFRSATTLPAAVQVLAESADLTGLVIDNIVFVTTREHAHRLREQMPKKLN